MCKFLGLMELKLDLTKINIWTSWIIVIQWISICRIDDQGTFAPIGTSLDLFIRGLLILFKYGLILISNMGNFFNVQITGNTYSTVSWSWKKFIANFGSIALLSHNTLK